MADCHIQKGETMKKYLFAAVLILVMLLASSAFACAEDGIQPRDTNAVTFAVSRISRTKADVTVDVTFSTVVDRYSVVIYLQKKVNGQWVNDSTNEEYVFYNNGFKEDDFLFGNTYTHLSEGVTYRIKCVSKDYIGDSTYIFTSYSNQF